MPALVYIIATHLFLTCSWHGIYHIQTEQQSSAAKRDYLTCITPIQYTPLADFISDLVRCHKMAFKSSLSCSESWIHLSKVSVMQCLMAWCALSDWVLGHGTAAYDPSALLYCRNYGVGRAQRDAHFPQLPLNILLLIKAVSHSDPTFTDQFFPSNLLSLDFYLLKSEIQRYVYELL